MSEQPTKSDYKRLTIRMIELKDEFRELEDRVEIMSGVLRKHAQILVVRPISIEESL